MPYASSLLGPQAAPALGADRAFDQLAGIRLGDEMQALTAFLPALRLSLVLQPDAIAEDLDWGRKPVQALLDANPVLQVHQMHDPVQDRLMVERMAYFRIKRLQLGRKFEDFLGSGLIKGATIIVLECTLRWPATRVADRHIFQAGGYGGATLKEYFEGGGRVERFLERRHRLRSRSWTNSWRRALGVTRLNGAMKPEIISSDVISAR